MHPTRKGAQNVHSISQLSILLLQKLRQELLPLKYLRWNPAYAKHCLSFEKFEFFHPCRGTLLSLRTIPDHNVNWWQPYANSKIRFRELPIDPMPHCYKYNGC